MIEVINKAWDWTGAIAVQVFSVNSFGHVIFKSDQGEFWHLCPETLECKIIANSREALNELMDSEAFMEDWEMFDLTEAALAEVGNLEKGEKYCLKLPTVLGGLYDATNLGKIDHATLITYCGELAFRIKDLPDGEKFKVLLE